MFLILSQRKGRLGPPYCEARAYGRRLDVPMHRDCIWSFHPPTSQRRQEPLASETPTPPAPKGSPPYERRHCSILGVCLSTGEPQPILGWSSVKWGTMACTSSIISTVLLYGDLFIVER